MRKKRQKMLTGLNQTTVEEVMKKISYNKQNRQMLPRLNYKQSWQTIPALHNQGLQSLQSCIQTLLMNTKKREYSEQQLKLSQENQRKKALLMRKERQSILREQERSKFKQLQRKLNELKGQMQLQQKKLKLQNYYEQKMTIKQERLYDRLYDRYAKKNVVECSINTEPININQCSKKQVLKSQQNPLQNRNESIILHKNFQEILRSQTKKQRNKPKKQRTAEVRKKDLKKKFRVAVYAVMFIFVFPRYSKKFSKRRKQYFQSQISIQNLNFELQNIYAMLDRLNLKQMVDKINNKNKDQAKLTTIQFLQQDDNGRQIKVAFKLNNIPQILTNLLQNIKQTIKAGHVNPLIKILSQLLLNRSFVLQSFYLPQELFRLRLHPQHNCLQLNIQQEMIGIINFIMVKIIAFQFLINNDKKKQQSEKVNYVFERQEVNIQYNTSQGRQLLLVGAYLVELCNIINFKVQIDDDSCFHGNVEQLKQQYIPMNDLIYENSLNFQNGQSIKTSRKILIAQKDFLRPYLQIKELNAFRHITQGLKKNYKKQGQILDIIIDIRKQLYQKLKKSKKNIYQQLKKDLFSQKAHEFSMQKEDQNLEKPTYFNIFKIQRDKFRKDHPELKSTAVISEISSKERLQTRLLFENSSIQEEKINEDNFLQKIAPDIIKMVPQLDKNIKSSKRLSNKNSINHQDNRQQMRKRFINKNSLIKMSNKQFSSGKSID